MATTKRKRKAAVALVPAGKPRIVGIASEDGDDEMVTARVDITLNTLYGYEVSMSRQEFKRIRDKIDARERVDLDEVDINDGDFLNIVSGEIEDIEDATGKAPLGNERPDGLARRRKGQPEE